MWCFSPCLLVLFTVIKKFVTCCPTKDKPTRLNAAEWTEKIRHEQLIARKQIERNMVSLNQNNGEDQPEGEEIEEQEVLYGKTRFQEQEVIFF